MRINGVAHFLNKIALDVLTFQILNTLESIAIALL